MKAFWSFIALLVVGTVVVFVVRGTDNRASGIGQQASGGEAAVAEDVPPSSDTLPEPEGTTSESPAAVDDPLARRVRTDHAHQGGAAPAADGDFMTMLFGASATSASAEITEEVRAKDEASRTAKVAQLPAGGIELDDRFTIQGKGSAEHPFVIPWELLMSAREVYVPKDERRIIPGRVSMFQGVWVEITGYVMLPTVRDRVSEFVIMQNQWDGCCIGIPPTPYDSVEVTLAEPMDFGFGMRQYATVTGRMRVDPYLFGNRMLLGLYAIEDARIRVTEF